MMYSFEGYVDSRREQNLAGASRKEHRDALLKRTQLERQKRQEERRRNDSVLLLQSCIRSYLSRKHSKAIERQIYDKSESSGTNIQSLKPLLRQFVFFFDKKQDLPRLYKFSEKCLKYKSLLLEHVENDSSIYLNIKKFLCIILNCLENNKEQQLLINCLDGIISSNEMKKRNIWPFLVKKGFFYHTRRLLDTNVHIDKTLSLISQPLLYINRSSDAESNIIFSEFCKHFLCPNLVESIKKYLIPHLKSLHSFPYLKLVKYIHANKKDEYTHNLLYFVLVLEPKFFVPTLETVEVVASLSECLKNFCITIDLTEDSDDEDEQMDTDQLHMQDFLQLLNDHDRVKKLSLFFDQKPDDAVLWALTQICHSILLYSNTGISKHMLVYSLALRRKYFYQLWCTIEAKHNNVKNNQYSLTLNGWTQDETMISVFCNMFILYTSVLVDRDTPTAVEIFSNVELCSICTLLKKLALNLIDLAFPMYRMNPYNPSPQLLYLYKTTLKTLRVLHALDLRKHFTPEGFWTKNKIHIYGDLSKRNYLSTVLKPFTAHGTKHNDEEMLPPLLTVEQRTLTILQELPFLVDFQLRLVMLRDLCKSTIYNMVNGLGFSHREFANGPSVIIRRTYLYEDAYDKLSPENEPDLRQKIRIQFINNAGLEEAGVDGGGIFKEFICELLKTAFNPNRGFFLLTHDNTLYPNPNVHLIEDNYASHYFFIGRMLGKALFENILVDLPLADFFVEKLLNEKVDSHHLKSMDPLLYKNLLFVRDYTGDVQDLGLDFTVVCDDLGETRIIELKPNGRNIPVTNANRLEYFMLITDFKLNTQIRNQCLSFRNGIDSIMPLTWLRLFNHSELHEIIGGDTEEMDITDLRNHTNYGGEFNQEHPTIVMFWSVLESFSRAQKKMLLKFVTSCSRPPLLGFKELVPPFCIQSAGTDDRMPSASTCLNLLKLPVITKEETMRWKLLHAIAQQSGFELS